MPKNKPQTIEWSQVGDYTSWDMSHVGYAQCVVLGRAQYLAGPFDTIEEARAAIALAVSKPEGSA